MAEIAAALAALDNPLRDSVVLKSLEGLVQHGNAAGPTAEAGDPANRAAPLLPAIGDPAAEYDGQADALGSWRDGVAERRCRHRRATVADEGEAIRLTLCGPAGTIGSVEIDPVRAVGLARDLLAAAQRRLTP